MAGVAGAWTLSSQQEVWVDERSILVTLLRWPSRRRLLRRRIPPPPEAKAMGLTKLHWDRPNPRKSDNHPFVNLPFQDLAKFRKSTLWCIVLAESMHRKGTGMANAHVPVPIARRQGQFRGKTFSWFEAGTGPAMVLLHGGGGTGRDWWYQLSHFSSHWRVIAPDLPGFGQSEEIPEVASVDAIAPVLWQWLAVLDVDTPVLGGNSMGGRVALSAASRNPKQVRALILLDAVGVELPTVPIQNPLELPPHQFVEGLVFDPQQYRKNTPYRTIEDARELGRGRQTFARYLAATPIAPDRLQDLTVISMPTLLLWGKDDRIVPVEYGRALASRLAQAELVVLADCGHLPHVEEPKLTNELIERFLANL